MRTLSYLILPVVLVTLQSTRAYAVLVEAADPNFGPGTLTVDTRTGLSWLNLTLTLNLSYQAAEAAMQPGNPLYGYRHATFQEVGGLFNSAGIALGYSAPSSPGFAAADAFSALIGSTESRDGQFGGVYPNATAIANAVFNRPIGFECPVPEILYGYNQNGVDGYYASTHDLNYGLNTSASTVGNWVVAIPEPTIVCVSLLGSAFWMAAGRKAATAGAHKKP